MDVIYGLAWMCLALIHVPPALVALKPSLVARLYHQDPQGDLGVLLRHRAMMFGAIVILCSLAAIFPAWRAPAWAVTFASMLGFLALYQAAGAPLTLRIIARADALGLAPLALAAGSIPFG